MADRFAAALRQAERTGEVEGLVSLFVEDGAARNLSPTHDARGSDELRRFWRVYLQAVERVETTFERVSSADGLRVLEWRSQGRLRDGRPIDYRGVSVLELDGDRVRAFRTDYDCAAFVPTEVASAV